LHLSPRGRLSNGPGRGGPIYRSVPARCMAGRWPCSSSHKLVRREIAEARMRTIRQGVNRLDLAGLSCQPERSGRDMEKLRGLTEVQPRFDSVIGGFVDGNAVMRAQVTRSRVQRLPWPVTKPFLFRMPAMRSSSAIS